MSGGPGVRVQPYVCDGCPWVLRAEGDDLWKREVKRTGGAGVSRRLAVRATCHGRAVYAGRRDGCEDV